MVEKVVCVCIKVEGGDESHRCGMRVCVVENGGMRVCMYA